MSWVEESNLSALLTCLQPKKQTGFFKNNNTLKKSKFKKEQLGLRKDMLSSEKCAVDLASQ